MRVLVDTNVVLDVLLERHPYYTNSSKIFMSAGDQNIQLFITATIVTDLYYIVAKILSKSKAKEFLSNLLEVVDVCGVNKRAIIEAMNSKFEDLEDAVQYFSAKFDDIDIIITRNKKDFKHSQIKVLTPAEYVKTVK